MENLNQIQADEDAADTPMTLTQELQGRVAMQETVALEAVTQAPSPTQRPYDVWANAMNGVMRDGHL